MADPRRLPDIPTDALRDHGTHERVERLWQRLEGDLGTGRPRPRSVLVWAPAALLIVFGSGVFVGARWFRAHPSMPTPLTAERPVLEESRPSQGPAMAQPGKTDERGQSKDKKGIPTLPHPSSEPEAPPPSVGELPPASTALVPVEQPEWIVLGKSADYKGAWSAIDRQGGFDAVLGKASADQKMMMADLARANKQPAQAIKALRSIIEQNPNDPRAPLAAWTLGSMLERSNDRAGAAKAYAMYRQLSPKGDFAEDALGRQFDAALAQGDVEQAKKLADQYAKDFPAGRRLNEMRSKVSKPGGPAAKPEKAPDSGSAAKVEDDTPYDEVDDEPAPAPKR